MELLLTRVTRSEKTTIGTLSIDGAFQCYTLEDKDRGLTSAMTLAQIKAIKVHGATCIPAGRYAVKEVWWPRKNGYYLQLQGVPGFEGIFMHEGNYDKDTEGCPLVGQTKAKDFVGNSVKALTALDAKVQPAVDRREPIFITVQ